MKSISVLLYGFQIGALYSRIDLTNAQYRSLNDLRSLNLDEWRLINPKNFNDFFRNTLKMITEI
jgi:hypothetical protein